MKEKQLCHTCKKADKTCPIYGETYEQVVKCVEYTPKEPDNEEVDDNELS